MRIEPMLRTPPRWDWTPWIEEMLEVPPPALVAGVDRIVLRCWSELSSKQRRRKHRILGRYNPPWRGRAAWIELFVDVIEDSAGFRLRFFVKNELARVLFHELGHHVHRTKRPEYEDPEAVADRYGEEWRILWLRTRSSARRIRPLLKALGPLIRWLVRTLKKWQQ